MILLTRQVAPALLLATEAREIVLRAMPQMAQLLAVVAVVRKTAQQVLAVMVSAGC
tara:strand:- start:19 stop:186 length:168 start_codon:yes stop_codon:yes gene_type:complete